MTNEHIEMLNRINDYANQVMPDIDPQKTPISTQLEKLRPIMQQIAMEKKMSVEDVFILYMDLASEAGVERENKFQAELNDGPGGSFSSLANKLQ